MNMDEYAQQAWSLALPTAKSHHYLIPGLAGEMGEVASLYAKKVRDGWKGSGGFSEALAKELGDVLWFVACIAAYEGIDLSTVALENLSKLYDRKQRGVLQGSGDTR